MISKEIFKREINKLVIEFSDKGFSMSKERAGQWYVSMENLTEYQISQAVKTVLRTSKYVPTMSEVYSVAITIGEPYKPFKIIDMEVM